FDVAGGGDGDDDFFFWDEVFDRHVAVVAVEDLGATLIAVALNDAGEFFGDDLALADRRFEDLDVFGDLGLQFVVFVLNVLPFQGCQLAQLHQQDCTGLFVVDGQQGLELYAGHIGRGRSANGRDDLIEHVQGFEQALEDVGAFFGFAFAVGGPADDDFDLVFDPVVHESVERQRAWDTVNQGQHVG